MNISTRRLAAAVFIAIMVVLLLLALHNLGVQFSVFEDVFFRQGGYMT